jgi:hypothetical protein
MLAAQCFAIGWRYTKNCFYSPTIAEIPFASAGDLT